MQVRKWVKKRRDTHWVMWIFKGHISEKESENTASTLRGNPPDVRVTSGQKIIYIVLQTSVWLFLSILSKEIISNNTKSRKQMLKITWNTWNYW